MFRGRIAVFTVLAASILAVQGVEPGQEPDLTVSKDYGIARRMTTQMIDAIKWRSFREADFAKLSLDDPVLITAYIEVFLHSSSDINDTYFAEEYQAAFNDMKRRGEAVAPLLQKLMQANPDTAFESSAMVHAPQIASMNPSPFIEYARTALQTRWNTLQPGTVGGICYLLIRKGLPSDLELLRDIVKKRPYLTDTIESEITAAKRPGGPLAPQTGSTIIAQPPSITQMTPRVPKPTDARPATASNESASSTPWSIIVVLIVAAIGLLWLLLKRRS